MSGPYNTETFDNIPPEKQERILRAAAEIFGRDGVDGARMGEIAKQAGISHGSLFTYFPTKDHLVRALVARGTALQAERFSGASGTNFDEEIHDIFERAWETASAENGLISLWLSLSLSENSRFSDDILPLEKDASDRWNDLVAQGREAGAIGRDIDPRIAVFVLDSVIAQLMKSRASDLECRKLDLLFAGVDDVPAFVANELLKLLGNKAGHGAETDGQTTAN
jgi:AcrR family transcriptional regulator